MKPDHKEPYEVFNIGDDVKYLRQRMTIVSRRVQANGLIYFDLEADTCIYKDIPCWCCSVQKYSKHELVPSPSSGLESLLNSILKTNKL